MRKGTYYRLEVRVLKCLQKIYDFVFRFHIHFAINEVYRV